jgi:mono/diheme cytochrome c family protein/DNA-binding beta-propeller fold protein YncE
MSESRSTNQNAGWVVISLATALFAGSAAADAPDAATERQKQAWSSEWSDKVGVSLEYQLDSSGPDAWDPKEHPNVFITTEGPGYGGLLSGVTLPGLAIIDADTREVVASAKFDVLSWGWSNVFEPHGLGVSPDGKWIYLPTGEGSFMTIGDRAGRFLVINARTLKIDKVIRLQGQAHHASSYRTPDGEQRVILYGWSQPMFVLDPDDDNRAVGSISHQEQGSEGYLYFASPDGDEIIGTGRYRDFDMRKQLSDNPIWTIDAEAWKVKKWIKVPDSAPVWVSYTVDGKNVYVTGARGSIIMHVDLESGKFASEQRAGVDGPYGNHFGWDDKIIYTIGKGEESHNRGKMLGMVDTTTMEVPGSRAMDQFYTGCIRGDHGTLHPDPEANEMWISCNASFDVVIFDLDLKDVTARIPLPNGGSTHSGAFVSYADGWNLPGETVSDHNGLHGSALETKRRLMSGAGASAGAAETYLEMNPEFAEGRRVFESVAGIGCKSCHGEFAEGDLGVGPYTRGATEGAIRAAIEGIGEMVAIKTVITDEEIKAVSEYLRHLGGLQVARTLSKRGRFLPGATEVRPGTPVQVVIRNAGTAPAQYASDNMDIESFTVPGRSTGSFEWRAPETEGEYSIYCGNCKLSDQQFTINVHEGAP